MWPAIIAAGASILGGAMANRQSEKNSAASMEWQEHMRDTQYQSAVKDLRAAGLNPMLAYGNGGNSTPSAPNVPQVQNIGAQAGQSALAAMQTQRVEAETDLLEAQAEAARAQANASNASAGNLTQNTENLKAQLPEISARIADLIESKNLKYHQGLSEVEKRNLMDAQRKVANIEYELKSGQIDLQDAQKRLTLVQGDMAKLQIPGLTNTAKWEETMGMIERSGGAAGKAVGAIGAMTNTARKVLGK